MGTTIPIRSQSDIETIKKYFLEKEQYRNYALFVVGINTALRISDLLDLDWGMSIILTVIHGKSTWRSRSTRQESGIRSC